CVINRRFRRFRLSLIVRRWLCTIGPPSERVLRCTQAAKSINTVGGGREKFSLGRTQGNQAGSLRYQTCSRQYGTAHTSSHPRPSSSFDAISFLGMNFFLEVYNSQERV